MTTIQLPTSPLVLLTCNLQIVRRDQVQNNLIQPKGRVTEAAVQTLLAQIIKSRVIAPPILVPEPDPDLPPFMSSDGHRRWTVAGILGITSLACIVIPDADPIDLFIKLNVGVRPVSGREWLTIWARSTNRERDLAKMPKSILRNINQCLQIWTEHELIAMGHIGEQSPNIWTSVRSCQKIMGGAASTLREIKPSTIGDWVIRQAMQRAIIEMGKLPQTPTRAKRLHGRITTDQKLIHTDIR